MSNVRQADTQHGLNARSQRGEAPRRRGRPSAAVKLARVAPQTLLLALVVFGSATTTANAGDKQANCVNPPCPIVTDFNNSHPFKTCFTKPLVLPYRDDSYIYGYYDYCPGRGPLLTLGDGTLQQGFRGYGMFGSPGWGRGLEPTSYIDLSRYQWFPLLRHNGKHKKGISPREVASLPQPTFLPDPGPMRTIPRRITTGETISP
jgi:hypothetical protein